jgi:cation diffusion facilitator family transporter
MNQETVSILSTFVNLILVIFKLILGFLINSAALLAEGIHSGLDVFSSFVTYLGIKAAKKPVDEKHPYGYYKAESIAGLVVTFLLFISALWILYEGGERFFKAEPVYFSLAAIVLMVFSTGINEIMARLKFKVGQKTESLSLVADAEHSRADVISSLGVLLGLFLIKFFPLADAILAVLIGLYIIFECFSLGKEVTDSLLDVANKDLEEKIKEICKKEGIEVSGIKTRKIGPANFAEIKINLSPQLKIDQASNISKSLENKLLDTLPELKYAVISVESHEFKEGAIVPRFAKRFGFRRGFEPIGPKKQGKRIIIPIEQGEISEHFGVAEYLVIDRDEKGKILFKEFIKNPYFEEKYGHGTKFAKAISADTIITKHIGENAKRNLEASSVEIKITQKQKLEEVLKEI